MGDAMSTTVIGDVKIQNKIRTAKLVFGRGSVSRQEIAVELGFSMPTVFQNVNELLACGLLYEGGSYGSTGGRKAKTLSISHGFRYVIGLDITMHHVRFVLEDVCGQIEAQSYERCVYSDTMDYYRTMASLLETFIKRQGVDKNRLLGVGISIPGIVNADLSMVTRSHALGISNVPLSRFSQYIPYPVCFGNDAKNAAFAEIEDTQSNTVYLSLNATVGGAFYDHGQNYSGDHYRSAEFGHMVIVPGGKRCYCGKAGCLDAYCSANALLGGDEGNLEDFFNAVAAGEPEAKKRFDSYLEYLAIGVSNLRMAFDCSIILGGDIGGYLDKYLPNLMSLMDAYNKFETDASYIHTGHYKNESSAVGAAKRMIEWCIDQARIF